MPDVIEQWWPRLEEAVRDWLVNNYWSPLHEDALGQIHGAGVPDADSEYWKRESDGGRYLPGEAVRWIIAHPDSSAMSRPQRSDPRAAYFRRTWPQRP